MELKDYAIEQLRAELKKKSNEIKSEKAKVKRCRMCKHWGKITYWGEDLSSEKYEWLKRVNCSKCCIFFKNNNGKNYRSNSPYQLDCQHFEEKQKTL